MEEQSVADAGLARVREAVAALRLPSPGSLGDRDLLELQRALGEVRRLIDAAVVPLAAETARRSAREFGHGGLAQRLGVRTPEMLVQRMTGVTAREARDLVTAGGLGDATILGSAVQDGRVSVAAASVITSGLGAPSASVTPRALEDAEAVLVAEAPGRTVEQLAARAPGTAGRVGLRRRRGPVRADAPATLPPIDGPGRRDDPALRPPRSRVRGAGQGRRRFGDVAPPGRPSIRGS